MLPVDGAGADPIPGDDWELEHALGLEDTSRLGRRERAHSIYLFWDADGSVEHWYVNLERPAAPDAGRLRHVRREARPDRAPGRQLPLEGRGRARAGGVGGAARRRRGAGRGRAGAGRVALSDRVGGVAAGSVLAAAGAPATGTAYEATRAARGLRRAGLLWGTGGARPRRADRGRRLEGRAGLLLLLVAVASLPTMLLTGREIDRRGTRILPVAIVALAAPPCCSGSPTDAPRSPAPCSCSASPRGRPTWR